MNPVPTLEEVEIRKKKMFFQPKIIDAACSFLLSCEINHRKTDYDILIDKCFQNKSVVFIKCFKFSVFMLTLKVPQIVSTNQNKAFKNGHFSMVYLKPNTLKRLIRMQTDLFSVRSDNFSFH